MNGRAQQADRAAWQAVGAVAGRLERLYLDWIALDPSERPEFLTWAHGRRHSPEDPDR